MGIIIFQSESIEYKCVQFLCYNHLIVPNHTNPASLDYVANSVSLKLTDSSPRSFSFNVTLLDDGVAEMSEQFSVVIRPEPTSMTHFTSDEIKSTVTITDNDGEHYYQCKIFPFLDGRGEEGRKRNLVMGVPM